MKYCYLLLLMVMSFPSFADRALLIGVGEYENFPRRSLRGVPTDLRLMEQVVRDLGFRSDQIRILTNKDATVRNIKRAITEHLIEGVNHQDRVLFYFTGHGLQIRDDDRDETDGLDEVLAGYDLKGDLNNLSGYLLDDDFGDLLDQIRADNIMVFLDACHSQTATRGIEVEATDSKYFELDGRYSVKSLDMDWEERLIKSNGHFVPTRNERFVSLAACLDGERAISGAKGSYFTRGLHQVISQASQNGEQLSWQMLRDRVQAYVYDEVQRQKVFHPELAGDKRRWNDNLFKSTRSIDVVPAPFAWRSWLELQNLASYAINLRANKPTFSLGEELFLTFDSLPKGYLNIISVGPDGIPVLLFPNRWHQNNRVEDRTVNVPSDIYAPFRLVAREPRGGTLVIAIHSLQDINFYRDYGSPNEALTVLKEDQLKVVTESVRSIAVEPTGSGKLGIGRLDVLIN